jgi:hypothetical protein
MTHVEKAQCTVEISTTAGLDGSASLSDDCLDVKLPSPESSGADANPTRRSFIAGSAAAGALVLFLLGTPSYAQAPGNNLLSMHPRAAAGGTAIRPFRVNVPEADLVDLRRRLADDTLARQGNGQ